MGLLGTIGKILKVFLLMILISLFSISTSVALYSYNFQPLLFTDNYISKLDKYQVFNQLHSISFEALDIAIKKEGLVLPEKVRTDLSTAFSSNWIKREISNISKNFLGYLRGEKKSLSLELNLPSDELKKILSPDNLITEFAKDKIDVIKKQNPNLSKTIEDQLNKLQCMPIGFTKEDIQPYFPEFEIQDNLRTCNQKETEEMLGTLLENVNVESLIDTIDPGLQVSTGIAASTISEEDAKQVASEIKCIPQRLTKKDLEDVLGIQLPDNLPTCKNAIAAPLMQQSYSKASFQTGLGNLNNLESLLSIEFPKKLDLTKTLNKEILVQLKETQEYVKIFQNLPMLATIAALVILGLIILLNILHPITNLRWIGIALTTAGFSTFLPSLLVNIYLPNFIKPLTTKTIGLTLGDIGKSIFNALIELVHELNFGVLWQSEAILGIGIVLFIISFILGFIWNKFHDKKKEIQPTTTKEQKQ